MKKRILSLLLAAVIALSLLPLSATALVMSPADKLSFSINGHNYGASAVAYEQSLSQTAE